jgi:hypothetical protein
MTSVLLIRNYDDMGECAMLLQNSEGCVYPET